MQPTNTTNANPKPNPLTHVGPLWFFIWVIWLTLISALPQATPTVLFVTGLTGAIGLVSIVVSLFVVALGALVAATACASGLAAVDCGGHGWYNCVGGSVQLDCAALGGCSRSKPSH